MDTSTPQASVVSINILLPNKEAIVNSTISEAIIDSTIETINNQLRYECFNTVTYLETNGLINLVNLIIEEIELEMAWELSNFPMLEALNDYFKESLRTVIKETVFFYVVNYLVPIINHVRYAITDRTSIEIDYRKFDRTSILVNYRIGEIQ